jgi:MFS family permease
VTFIFLMALVPLTSRFLDSSGRIALLMFLLFGFNLSRGISSAAWLPWITALVPAEIRGHYLARDSACVNAASAVTLLLTGAVLGPTAGGGQFAVVFAFSALMGSASLLFLRRIPDARSPEAETSNPEPVPWKAIAGYPPFRRLIWMNLAWAVSYGGLGAFTVAFLRSETGLTEDWVLYATAISYVGGIGGLLLFGSRLDRHGSRPVLLVCLTGWVFILLGWVCISAGVVAATFSVIVILQLGMGLGYAVFSMANTRLAMATMPAMGRNHFFALFSVVGNLTLGTAPVLWGLLIDAIGTAKLRSPHFELNRFSVFFVLVALTFVAAVLLCRRVEEPRARNVQELLRDLLTQTPFRSWIRLWPRG